MPIRIGACLQSLRKSDHWGSNRLLKKSLRTRNHPQGLKPESIFSDLAARVELVPFPFLAFFEFFRSLLKPALILAAYAALKGRSSTVAQNIRDSFHKL